MLILSFLLGLAGVLSLAEELRYRRRRRWQRRWLESARLR